MSSKWRCSQLQRRVSLGRLPLGALLLLPLLSTAAPGAEPRTKGFVVNYFVYDFYPSEQACPEGLNLPPDRKKILDPMNLPPAEYQRLMGASLADPGVDALLVARGPKNENVCQLPLVVPDPGFRMAQGKVNYGMNLDGKVSAEDFVSPAGEKGIDNQLARVYGCVKNHIAPKGLFPVQAGTSMMREGEYTILINITDLDDERNDADVGVDVYAGKDPIVRDAAGNSVSHASFRVSDNPFYHSHTRGKIVNGVLTTTKPVDMNLRYEQRLRHLNFLAARLQLKLAEDGTAKGWLAGYHDWDTLYRYTTIGGYRYEEFGSFTCPGLYRAFKRAADAYPDPKTGENTAISLAFQIEALPAFVVTPQSQPDVKLSEAAR